VFNERMKKLYYIDYPQEHVEGQAHTYRCIYCKIVTTKINGTLQGHLPTCEYRLKLEREGYEKNSTSTSPSYSTADDFD
jgi:hypothetical protein